jgi:hypothetical protein
MRVEADTSSPPRLIYVACAVSQRVDDRLSCGRFDACDAVAPANSAQRRLHSPFLRRICNSGPDRGRSAPLSVLRQDHPAAWGRWAERDGGGGDDGGADHGDLVAG